MYMFVTKIDFGGGEGMGAFFCFFAYIPSPGPFSCSSPYPFPALPYIL